MKKKINKIKQLKDTIHLLEEKNDQIEADKSYYHRLLNEIDGILSIRGGRISFDQLPLAVMKLHNFRETNEGAKHVFADVVENQREIIRWLIKPSSADNAKELEMLKKGRFN